MDGTALVTGPRRPRPRVAWNMPLRVAEITSAGQVRSFTPEKLTSVARVDRPAASNSRPRRRDRHGRGLRGPLAPPQVPIALSRSELFDDYVRESVERLVRHWPQLNEVDFAVQDVPGPVPGEPEPEPTELRSDEVPLGRLVPARKKGDSPRIVVYRRPVENRAKGRDERAALVHEVVVEQVAEFLGVDPETVDPRFGEFGGGFGEEE